MTIADIKHLDRKLKVIHSHTEMLPLGPGAVWWQWPEDRWKGKWQFFASDGPSDSSSVVTLLYELEESAGEPDRLLASLKTKWGEPTLLRMPDSRRLAYGIAASTFSAEESQLVTRWEDPVCDVAATFIERSVLQKTVPTVGMVLTGVETAHRAVHLYVRLDRLSALNAQADKAMDVLK